MRHSYIKNIESIEGVSFETMLLVTAKFDEPEIQQAAAAGSYEARQAEVLFSQMIENYL